MMSGSPTPLICYHPVLCSAVTGPVARVDKGICKDRFRDIRAYDRYLDGNGVIVRKFFLHVSQDEQKKRFLDRLQEPEKHWKFNAADLAERKLWSTYRTAFEEALSQTSTAWAPWYVIPADDKWYSRAAIADIIASKLEALDLKYPEVSDDDRAKFADLARQLSEEK